MEQGDLPEVGPALPTRRRLQRIVDLHVALTVAVTLETGGDFGGPRLVAQQPAVELIGSHRADYALPRRDRIPRGEPHAARATAGIEDHAIALGAAANFAAVVVNEAFERGQQGARPADRDRASRQLDRESDQLDHRSGIRAFRIEAAMQPPRRP